jgi:peptidyl-prolyl cis-trans isomerase A (cyclophilin A)
MKNRILILLFLAFTATFAQKGKPAVKFIKPKVVTTTTNSSVPKVVSPMKVAIPTTGIFAEIETTKGKMVLVLEYKKAPVTVANFISLAEGTNTFVGNEALKGKHFYDGLKFHRVIPNFMIQGGDPLGNGSGDPGYKFKDEFDSTLIHDKGGILSMANSGPTTNGSQFFITHKDTPWLNGKHTIFGHIVSGMEVVNAILQDDVMTKVTIVRKGAEATKFDAAKIFAGYMANKTAEDLKEFEKGAAARKIQEAADAEKRKQQEIIDAEAKKTYLLTYGPIVNAKLKELTAIKASGIKGENDFVSKIVKTGNGKKPTEGANIYVYYSGYLEDGTLFDSNVEEVSKIFGKFDQRRKDGKGYEPFPFQYGKKDGLIPGFIKGLESMNFNDKNVLFIPAAMAYGARGAGNVIPPNSNIIFEVEILESLPGAVPVTTPVDK